MSLKSSSDIINILLAVLLAGNGILINQSLAKLDSIDERSINNSIQIAALKVKIK